MSFFNRWLQQRRERKLHKKSLNALFEKLSDTRYLPARAELEVFFSEPEYWMRLLTLRPGELVYEFWNREVVRELAMYLMERGYRNIVEVGAGDGRLSYFLRPYLSTDVTMVATDTDGGFGYHGLFPVEKMRAREAILAYHPDAVIASWMPKNQDWTQDFRNELSVQEYILIGPAEHMHENHEGFSQTELSDITSLLVSRMTPTGEHLSRAISFRRIDT